MARQRKGPWYTTIGRRVERVADAGDSYEKAYRQYVKLLAETEELDGDERPSQLTVKSLSKRFFSHKIFFSMIETCQHFKSTLATSESWRCITLKAGLRKNILTALVYLARRAG